VIAAARAVTLVILALAGSSMSAADEVEPLRLGADRSGLPQRFVAPEYPAEALERHITGYVDVEGVVDGGRKLADPVFRPGSPEAEVFVPALRIVVPDWYFYPRYGKGNCVPTPARMGLRVVFELVQGQPKISTNAPEPPAPAPGKRRPRCGKIRYPHDALRNEETAIVYTRVNFDADGIASSVETSVFPDHGSFIDDGFKEAVKYAMSSCRFDPAEYPSPPRAACFDVIFNVRSGPLH